MFAAMEFINLMKAIVWALYEWSQAADDAGCLCHAEPDPAEPSPRRLPPREKGVPPQRACCDVAYLLVAVNSWLTQ